MRPLRHLALLQVLDELSRSLPPGLADGLQDARLGHPPQVVVDGRRPACGSNVEPDCLGEAVGVAQRTRAPIPGLVHRIDAQRDAMCEQGIATVPVEGRERIPELG